MTFPLSLPRLATFTAGLALGLTLAHDPAPARLQDAGQPAQPPRPPQPPQVQPVSPELQELKEEAESLQKSRQQAWTRFEQNLYGRYGRIGMIENVRARILELADLGDPESKNFDDQMFFLGFMRLFQEMGTVIPGRNMGVQTVGHLEILTESFEGDDWVIDAPMVTRLRDNPLGDLPAGGLRIPKGRFVKFIDRHGLHAAGTDLDTLEEQYLILVGMGDQAALIYPNLHRADAPWVAWLPGRTVEASWTRPTIPKSSFHGRGPIGRPGQTQGPDDDGTGAPGPR